MADQDILKNNSITKKEVEFKEIAAQDEENNKKTDVLQDTGKKMLISKWNPQSKLYDNIFKNW